MDRIIGDIEEAMSENYLDVLDGVVTKKVAKGGNTESKLMYNANDYVKSLKGKTDALSTARNEVIQLIEEKAAEDKAEAEAIKARSKAYKKPKDPNKEASPQAPIE